MEIAYTGTPAFLSGVVKSHTTPMSSATRPIRLRQLQDEVERMDYRSSPNSIGPAILMHLHFASGSSADVHCPTMDISSVVRVTDRTSVESPGTVNFCRNSGGTSLTCRT